MRSRKTPSSNFVYRLEGGTEDNDLHVRRTTVGDYYADDPASPDALVVVSVWEPSQEDRALIAGGANIELAIVGGQPPVSLSVTEEQPLSRPQRVDRTPRVWLELPVARAVEVLERLDKLDDLLVDRGAGREALPSEALTEVLDSLRASVEAAIRQGAEAPRGPGGEHEPPSA